MEQDKIQACHAAQDTIGVWEMGMCLSSEAAPPVVSRQWDQCKGSRFWPGDELYVQAYVFCTVWQAMKRGICRYVNTKFIYIKSTISGIISLYLDYPASITCNRCDKLVLMVLR